jgi:hypothetical protein
MYSTIKKYKKFDFSVLSEELCKKYTEVTAIEDEPTEVEGDLVDDSLVVLETSTSNGGGGDDASDFEHWCGNLFFGWWRQNKEFSSATKYFNLISLHVLLIDVLEELTGVMTMQLQKHRDIVRGLLHPKKKEVLDNFIVRCDYEGTVKSYDYYRWCTTINDEIDKRLDLTWDYNGLLTLEKTQGTNLQKKCNPLVLCKNDKLDVMIYLKRRIVQTIADKLAETQQWCLNIHKRNETVVASLERSEPSSVSASNGQTSDGKEKYKDKSSLSATVTSLLARMEKRFAKDERKCDYDIILGWWMEGVVFSTPMRGTM